MARMHVRPGPATVGVVEWNDVPISTSSYAWILRMPGYGAPLLIIYHVARECRTLHRDRAMAEQCGGTREITRRGRRELAHLPACPL